MSAPILTESRRVLSYPHVAKRWPLNSDVIDQYVSLLSEASDMVDMPSSFPALISDPDDDPILQTAIQGHADILCTRDAAFSHDVVREACQAHGIRLLDDIALMHELRLAKKQIGVHFRAAA